MATINLIKSKLPDITGVCVSLVCAAHCILGPWIGMLLVFTVDEHHYHQYVLLAGLPLTLLSVYRNAKRRAFIPNWLMLVGWILFIVGEFFLQTGAALLQTFAGLCVGTGHGWSMRKTSCNSTVVN